LSAATLLWGLLFGSVGSGFFVYGRRQGAVVPLVCGLILIVLPYFIANLLALVLAGATVVAIPYFVRI
jgi:hypothetical protein